jgi:ABC-type polysaccharide/polyol phosphate transport system ATPase subunit
LNAPIITVDGLGKQYRIRHQQSQRYVALRDVLAAKLAAPLRWSQRRGQRAGITVDGPAHKPLPKTEDFWALDDVSFEVRRGEVMGIIGRNGAGKSTLLKILSRITEPTRGRVTLRGSVGSLLEVGTGFHPELTGRENVYLNGALLGMPRAEVRRKFDEIVAFADVEKFLDTPVKRYSSGMYVRLAFAVAAHLEPDILIVDEVLAVGDAEFQKKCLNKMQDVSTGGRTVLFVSHNLAAVQSLCRTGILLERGRVTYTGLASDAVARYLDASSQVQPAARGRVLSPTLTLTRLECEPDTVRSGSAVDVIMQINATDDEVVSDLALHVDAPGGQRVALLDLRSPEGPYRLPAGGSLTVRSHVPVLPLVEADYNVGIYVNADSVCGTFMDVGVLPVLPTDSIGGIVPREPQFRGVVELRPQVEGSVQQDPTLTHAHSH